MSRMIPAPPGLTAHFHREDSGADARRVVAFARDGTPLVVPENGESADAALVTVSQYAQRGGWEYRGISDAEEHPLAVVPGGGWLMRGVNADGTLWQTPVVAWMQTRHGWMEPMVNDQGGSAEKADRREYGLYPPDQNMNI